MSNGADHLTIRPARAEDWPANWTIFRAVVAPGDTYAYPAYMVRPGSFGRGIGHAGDLLSDR